MWAYGQLCPLASQASDGNRKEKKDHRFGGKNHPSGSLFNLVTAIHMSSKNLEQK